MKRLHLHVRVEDLKQSIEFYSTLFGAKPTVDKDNYAKWLLEDPLMNFAITPVIDQVGIEHVGIQTDSAEELEDISNRLAAASIATLAQPGANCCYAVSDKNWTRDPSGINWETFHTRDSITDYGNDFAPTEEGAPPSENAHKPSAPGACSS